MNVASVRQEALWTLVIQTHNLHGDIPPGSLASSMTPSELPLTLTDCGEFVSKNNLTIPIAHDEEAKVLVAKGNAKIIRLIVNESLR